jgi:hypothetical protein
LRVAISEKNRVRGGLGSACVSRACERVLAIAHFPSIAPQARGRMP